MKKQEKTISPNDLAPASPVACELVQDSKPGLASKATDPAPVPEKQVDPPQVEPIAVTAAELVRDDSHDKPSDIANATEQISQGDLLNVETEIESPQPGETIADHVCPVCQKSFQYRSYLVRHIGKVHADKAAEVLPTIPGQSGDKKKRGQRQQTRANFDDIETETLRTEPEVKSVDYQSLAGMCFDISVNTSASAFGPEWLPRPSINPNFPDERTVVVNALATYLKSKEVKDIPPGLMLTIVVVAYAAPRLNAPSTRQKLGIGWTWLKSKFKRK